MAKITGPLFSNSASGTIGKAITFGKNQAGAWVRGVYKKITTYLPSQLEVRQWFKDVIDYFLDMADEERFLWELVLMNTKEYNACLIKQRARAPRCHLSHCVLSTRSYVWNGSPFPPELIQWLAKDDIPGYEQLMSDLETLTGLNFCDPVNPYFFPYLGIVTSEGHPGKGLPVAGLANARGAAIAIDEDYYYLIDDWYKKQLIAHELTHTLMNQHGWKYRQAVLDSETIADECGVRIANGELSPIYTYKGKTLSEWVPDPFC